MIAEKDSPFESLHVLIVDDNAQMRSILHTMLRSFGVKSVTPAVDGEDALEKLRDERFHIAICDWLMAPMDGLEFVKRVRAAGAPEIASLPVIMLTAQAEMQNVAAARAAGVDAYLLKPVSARQLWARLNAVYVEGKSVRVADDAAAAERAVESARRDFALQSSAYRETLAADAEFLGRCLADLTLRDWDRIETWRLFYRKLHDVKGQAATFGYELGTDFADAACRVVKAVLDDFPRRAVKTITLRSVLTAAVGALELVVRENIRGDGGPDGAALLVRLDTTSRDLLRVWGISGS